MANSLTLVDMSPSPAMVYVIMAALKEYAGHPYPIIDDTIDYIQSRMVDLDLPLEQEVYEETIKSPENETPYKHAYVLERVSEKENA